MEFKQVCHPLRKHCGPSSVLPFFLGLRYGSLVLKHAKVGTRQYVVSNEKEDFVVCSFEVSWMSML